MEQRLNKVEELIETHNRILESFMGRHGSPEFAKVEAHGSSNPPLNGTPNDYLTSPLTSVADSIPKAQASDAHGFKSASPTLPTGVSAEPNAVHVPPLGLPDPFAKAQIDDSGEKIEASHIEEFPAYDLLYSLVELYFSHINTWCPVLDRRSTLNLLFGSRTLNEADRMLLHAIVATTLRFSTDPRLKDDETRKRYYNRSKQKVLLYGIENSSVRALQAMVILALDLHGSSSIGSGLKMIACIARSAIQLGLATESSSSTLFPDYPSISTLRANVLPEPQDWIEDESRRRLFWMVYVLDRDATLATAFEFALDEKDVDRRLPCRDDYFAKGQAVTTRWFGDRYRNERTAGGSQYLGSFSYQVEIRGILTQIHQFLKRPMDVSALTDVSAWQKVYRELDLHLRTWQLDLPPEHGNIGRLTSASNDGYKTSLSPGWLLLQAFYYL